MKRLPEEAIVGSREIEEENCPAHFAGVCDSCMGHHVVRKSNAIRARLAALMERLGSALQLLDKARTQELVRNFGSRVEQCDGAVAAGIACSSGLLEHAD